MRRLRTIATVATLALSLPVVANSQSGVQDAVSGPSAASIHGWIEQLDHDRFAFREAATQNLIRVERIDGTSRVTMG